MTDQELILARAWAMLSGAERDVIELEFARYYQNGSGGRANLDKLADDWIEELRAEKAKLRKT